MGSLSGFPHEKHFRAFQKPETVKQVQAQVFVVVGMTFVGMLFKSSIILLCFFIAAFSAESIQNWELFEFFSYVFELLETLQ